MKRRETGEISFRSALSWSLLIHAGLLVLLAGLGGVLTPEQPETKLEWVWSAPQPTPQPPAAPVAPAATAAATVVNPAAATAAPLPATQPSTPQQTTTTPAAPVSPTSPPLTVPPPTAPPAATDPSADLPSRTGYAIVPPRLRERPPLAVPPSLAGSVGEVLLQVEVLADGRVGASRVIRSSGRRELDETARQYVAGWIFQPAWQPQANKPVRVLTSVWVQFGTKKE